ncbi:MAG TPA: hypothetical protein VIH57_13475 [Bacteroidales bacterium]
MKTFQLAIVLLLSFVFNPLSAQNESDVLRLSQTFTGGTARSIGMGGAFGALGGDMTSLSINPAGIGVYRSSEFTFTPTIGTDNTKSTFINNSYSDSKVKFNLNNIGYVYTYNTNKEEGWVSASFGIAYNRLNDFNKNATITAVNPYSSMLDGFTTNLNWNLIGTGQDIPSTLANDPSYSYYENLAYNTNAIWIDHTPGSIDSGYFVNDFKDKGELQQRIITTKGSIGEYAFSFGANYSNKLYLGATVGIDHVDYQEIKNHNESQTPSSNIMDNFTFIDNFKTWGTGYNIKIGLIYKPIDLIRLGLAFHSPTYYSLSSEFYTSMNVNFKSIPQGLNDTHYYDQTNVATFDYNITTPMRLVTSLAFQFQQLGVLSVDYEFVDYTSAKIRADNDPFTDVNNLVQNTYRSTGNLKIGAEAKIGDFALRAGFGYYGSPYNSNQFNKDASTTSYSFGLGYRGKSFFLDLGYILFNTKYIYKLYDYEELNTTDNKYYIYPETADMNSKYGKIAMTLGFRF